LARDIAPGRAGGQELHRRSIDPSRLVAGFCSCRLSLADDASFASEDVRPDTSTRQAFIVVTESAVGVRRSTRAIRAAPGSDDAARAAARDESVRVPAIATGTSLASDCFAT
jgi:hypothetical protein